MTRVGFAYVLTKHVQRAAQNCPSLVGKSVSPHVLRHTCALILFQATGDLRKVSLWLGHAHMQTTEMYLRADPSEKLEAIESVIPTIVTPWPIHRAGSIDCDSTRPNVMTSDRGRFACWHRLRSTHTFHNYKISIRTKNVAPLQVIVFVGSPLTLFGLPLRG